MSTTSSAPAVQFLPYLEGLQVDPNPEHIGGNSYRNMSLFEKRPHRMGFRANSTAVIYASVILFMGFASLGIALKAPEGGTGFDYLIAFLFIGFGLWLAHLASHRITFDKKRGLVWGGGRRPNTSTRRHGKRFHAQLSDIVALQLVREDLSHDNGETFISKVCYELNLVYQDGMRNNLVDHPDLKALYVETQKLALFLDVPVLVAFDPETEMMSGLARWWRRTFG